MHISEGVLSPSVLVAGAALTTAGVGIALKGLNHEEIPSVGILSAAFFVASLVHVPIGPASAHLVLNGLAEVVLGFISHFACSRFNITLGCRLAMSIEPMWMCS